jgi:hypothetical protein
LQPAQTKAPREHGDEGEKVLPILCLIFHPKKAEAMDEKEQKSEIENHNKQQTKKKSVKRRIHEVRYLFLV